MYNETEKVSSTLIKKLMDQGLIEEVNTLLDRPYKVKVLSFMENREVV